MKIAFDATVLHGRKSGVGYYCEELLRHIAENPDIELFVFSHRPPSTGSEDILGNVRYARSGFFPVRAFYLHAVLPRILKGEKPDLCHYTNFLAPVLDSTPYVVTIHDMSLERLRDAHPLAKRLYTRPLVPKIARGARLIVTNSEFSRWEIVRYLGIPADRIRVTPLAASADFYPVADFERQPVLRRYGLESPYFLYVGNLEPRKNLVRLLDAFAKLPDRSHSLVIVGNGWYRAKEVFRAAQRQDLAGRIRFTGYVPRADLAALYSGATAFVYPSLLEGFGMPVIEAMACGAPVITSDNSSLREIAEGAALLVDPQSTTSIREAMAAAAEDSRTRVALRTRGLERARRFSWEKTAALTLQVYREAVGERQRFAKKARRPDLDEVATAARRAIDYCAMFQYPLRIDELRERLCDVEIDLRKLKGICQELDFPMVGEFISASPEFVSLRRLRETESDASIREVWPHLATLAGMPFVRMIAFSGATAHRNMADREDVDLFLVVEDGRLWAFYAAAMLWAKVRGLRRKLCLNYVLSDRALPLFHSDLFTIQQAISLKPIYGKKVYDAFLKANRALLERFPNFTPLKARGIYPEIHSGGWKRLLEVVLRCGPVQILERLSRRVLGRYLERKTRAAAAGGDADVLLESRRLKLHLRSHKNAVLRQMESGQTVLEQVAVKGSRG